MWTPRFKNQGGTRRAFLKGIGGVTLGLPFLESLAARDAHAQAAATPHYAVFVRQANGVTQADAGEPEQYWPRNLGRVDRATLVGPDADRAISELADYADRMLLVRGTRFAFPGNGCGHSGGGNQVLTAARVSTEPSVNLSLAEGESIDNYIARQFPHNGGEPITLYTGPRSRYIEEVLSYRGPQQLRSAEDDPWTAYQRMLGTQNLDVLLENRRKSVNDLVRDQMGALLGRSDLSAADRRKLELHRDAIRDFEGLRCLLAADEEQEMASLAGLGTLNDNRVRVARMHMHLIALAFACDFARAATLQIGDGNDGTEYTIRGVRLPNFHMISHRIYGHGDEGDPIAGAIGMHHDIDRLHLEMFRHLLEKLDEFGILDQSIAVHTSDLGAGISHTYSNIPWIIVGGGDGSLKQGEYVDAGNVTHNRLLNTLITATGLRSAGGGFIEGFGDPSLTPGVLSEMMN